METSLSKRDILYRKNSNSAKRLHLDNSLEIKILAQNLHIPLAPSSKKDLNLGQSTKTGFIGPSIYHLCYQQVETT
jgi:hypothetical protein